jgi:hypothetical protein
MIISVLATNMRLRSRSGFEKTASATALALMQSLFITPFLLISPT